MVLGRLQENQVRGTLLKNRDPAMALGAKARREKQDDVQYPACKNVCPGMRRNSVKPSKVHSRTRGHLCQNRPTAKRKSIIQSQ